MMPPLAAGTPLALWPRTAVLLPDAREPVVLPAGCRAPLVDWCAGRTHEVPAQVQSALAPLLDDAPSDLNRVEQRLALLDERYVGWLPGFTRSRDPELRRVRAMHSRRKAWTLPRLARPTLPSSTLRRAEIIAALCGKKILLTDDPDGLGVLLATNADVTVTEPDPVRHHWLATEAARENNKLHLTTNSDIDGLFDVSVIFCGPPAASAAELGLAIRCTRPGGHIVVGMRLPWEEVMLSLAAQAGLVVERYEREIDHWLVPGLAVIDGGQDLVVYRRPEGAALPAIEAGVAATVRATPHGVLDIDSVPRATLDKTALTRFATLLAAAAPAAEEGRSLHGAHDHDVLCWYDSRGHGLTAELRRAEEHLLISIVPFDADLEYLALWAAHAVLCDDASRVRPLRTRRADKEYFFA